MRDVPPSCRSPVARLEGFDVPGPDLLGTDGLFRFTIIS